MYFINQIVILQWSSLLFIEYLFFMHIIISYQTSIADLIIFGKVQSFRWLSYSSFTFQLLITHHLLSTRSCVTFHKALKRFIRESIDCHLYYFYHPCQTSFWSLNVLYQTCRFYVMSWRTHLNQWRFWEKIKKKGKRPKCSTLAFCLPTWFILTFVLFSCLYTLEN